MKIICATPVVSTDEVRASQLFRNWADRVAGWDIPQVTVTDAFSWDGAIRMLLLRIAYGAYDHAALLRGPTVDVLTILECDGHKYIVHVDQPRVVAGQIVRSNAAGMVDDGETAAVAALRELGEELNVQLDWGAPINLNQVVYGTSIAELGTPGGSDEDVVFFAVHVRATPDALSTLQGRTGGLAEEGERITVHLTPFEGAAANALPSLVVNGQRPDMKASHSLLMYDRAMYLLNPDD